MKRTFRNVNKGEKDISVSVLVSLIIGSPEAEFILPSGLAIALKSDLLSYIRRKKLRIYR